MKRTIFFACAMLVCAMANAQIVKGTVGNGNYTDNQGQTTAAYGLDFNNDGNLELKLDSADYYGTMFANYSATYRWADSTNVVSDAATGDKFKFLNAGDTINAASGFNGQGDASLSTVFANDRYVGFRIGYPDGMHYGYAKIHFLGSTVQWLEIYYNATAGAPIRVGELPSAIESVEDNQKSEAKSQKFLQDGQVLISRGGAVYNIYGIRIR